MCVYECVCVYRASAGEALVEAGHAPKHLLAVRVQLLQLVLDEHGVQRGAALDQSLPKHDQRVDLIRVQGDLVLERLQGGGEERGRREERMSEERRRGKRRG